VKTGIKHMSCRHLLKEKQIIFLFTNCIFSLHNIYFIIVFLLHILTLCGHHQVLLCGNFPQCQTDGLSSFSTGAKQTGLLHINQQTILTPDEIAKPTHIYTACQIRAWSATTASTSQAALIPESSTPIG
jgi:hypothetical protein